MDSNGSTACYQHSSNGITMCVQNQWALLKFQMVLSSVHVHVGGLKGKYNICILKKTMVKFYINSLGVNIGVNMVVLNIIGNLSDGGAILSLILLP